MPRQAASLGRLGNHISQPIAAHVKAAEEGVAAAQFIIGLAHLEGYGTEKNERSAYHWLRMAEENSGAIEQRSRALLEKLRGTVRKEDIDAVEQRVAIWVQENKLLRSKSPAEFISSSADSGPLQMLRAFSPRTKAKAAS